MGMMQGALVPGDANPIDASAPLLSDILTHSWSPKGPWPGTRWYSVGYAWLRSMLLRC